MCALLAASLLAMFTVPIQCVTYSGEGSFYFTYSDRYEKSEGVRVIYRPEVSELYAKPDHVAYLAFAIARSYDIVGTVDNLTMSKYTGWTQMSWEPRGLYYFADYLQATLPGSLNVIVFGAEIFAKEKVIYSDDYRYSFITRYSPYCVHDSDQKYISQLKCSQALDGEDKGTTTDTDLSQGGDGVTTGSNSGAIVIGVVVPFIVLVMAVVLGCCARRYKVCRNDESQPTQSQDVERRVNETQERSHDWSHDTTDQPPPYTIAVEASLPDYLSIAANHNSLDPKDSLEQPPSYDIAVTNLQTVPENAHHISNGNNLTIEHSRDSFICENSLRGIRENTSDIP